MTNLDDLVVTSEDFISVNQVLDIPIGTEIELQTKGNTSVLIHRSVDKPHKEDINGRVMKGLRNKSSNYTVKSNSLETWLKVYSTYPTSVKVSASIVESAEIPIFDGITLGGNFSELGNPSAELRPL